MKFSAQRVTDRARAYYGTDTHGMNTKYEVLWCVRGAHSMIRSTYVTNVTKWQVTLDIIITSTYLLRYTVGICDYDVREKEKRREEVRLRTVYIVRKLRGERKGGIVCSERWGLLRNHFRKPEHLFMPKRTPFSDKIVMIVSLAYSG